MENEDKFNDLKFIDNLLEKEAAHHQKRCEFDNAVLGMEYVAGYEVIPEFRESVEKLNKSRESLVTMLKEQQIELANKKKK